MDTTHNASDENLEGVYIPKSYQFERDMDTADLDSRLDVLTFDDNANIHFVYDDMNNLIQTEEGRKTLAHMINTFFNSQKDRLSILEGYSKGQNYTILNGRRRIEQTKADYRISHNWGGYISSFATSYLLSRAITIGTKQLDDDETKTLQSINDINEENDIDTLNYELGFDASRYGRAFELHYRDDTGDKIVQIDPQEIFIIRSADVSKQMIGAVHLPIYNGKVHMTIYTDTHRYKYEPYEQGAVSFQLKDEGRHAYGMVPVVEWWNNRFRQGDFETEIPLMDSYDAVQSDTANYMSDINDAMLVINGDLLTAGIGASEADKMIKANVLLLETGLDHTGKQTSASAEYIYKQYDVAGSEAYKKRLINDIYKLSKIPNLDDDRFDANNSGIALKYKMLGLEQMRSIKESFYTKALRRRYRIIESMHSGLNKHDITANDLTFTFHTNLPEDVWAEVERFANVGGVVSDTTLMELASFIESPEDEKLKIANDGVRPDATDEELNGER